MTTGTELHLYTTTSENSELFLHIFKYSTTEGSASGLVLTEVYRGRESYYLYSIDSQSLANESVPNHPIKEQVGNWPFLTN